jgi:hypothetical protein
MTVKSTDLAKYLTVRASDFPSADLADEPAPIQIHNEKNKLGGIMQHRMVEGGPGQEQSA